MKNVSDAVTGTTKIFNFWKDANLNVEDIRLQEAAISLQLDAENVVAALKQAVATARQELDNAKRVAQTNQNFKRIVEAYIELEIVTKEHTQSVLAYTDLFGESPKFA